MRSPSTSKPFIQTTTETSPMTLDRSLADLHTALEHDLLQIQELKSRPDEPLDEIRLLEQRIARRQFDLSPLARLHSEIIVEIIEFVGIEEPHQDRWEDHTTLLHVCQAWRQVALSPHIWKTIRFDSSHRRGYQSLDFMTWRLGVTNDIPLDVFMDRIEGEYYSVEACRLLFTSMPRWERLTINLRESRQAHGYFSKTDGKAPSLKQLSIILIPEGAKLFRLFTETPLLRRVSLFGMSNSTPAQTESFRLPWAQLAHIALGGFEASTVLNTLRRCPSLTHAEIYWFTHNETSIAESLPVDSLPALEAIDITAWHGSQTADNAIQLFPHHISKITRLRFKSVVFSKDTLSFLFKKTSALRVLCLWSCTCPITLLAACLPSMPSLEELELSDLNETEEDEGCRWDIAHLFQKLTNSTPRSPTVVPLLKRLALIHNEDELLIDTLDDATLLADMIRSRCADGSSLRHLVLVDLEVTNDKACFAPEVIGIFNSIREGGFDLRVKHHSDTQVGCSSRHPEGKVV